MTFNRVCLELLERRTHLDAELVADLTTFALDTYVDVPTAVGNNVFYVADDIVSGAELWRTDGTPGGTARVKDIRPGVSGSFSQTGHGHQLAALGSQLLFFASDGVHGRELWRSDGTTAGTQMVLDSNLGSAGQTVYEMAVVGDWLYYFAFDGARTFLWRTDGSAAGTVVVKQIEPFISRTGTMAAVGQTLYFGGVEGTNSIALWKSDGTTDGTVAVKTFSVTGSSEGPAGFIEYNGKLLFHADDGVSGREFWTSDGTAAGTSRITDINPGAGGGFADVDGVVADGWYYFPANDGSTGKELWRTDGTAAGTSRVFDLAPGLASSMLEETLHANATSLFFAANTPAEGPEWWRLNLQDFSLLCLTEHVNPGTAGSHAASSVPARAAVVGEDFLFSAKDAGGAELWRSDGTVAGTQRVADLNSGADASNPGQFISLTDRLIFTAKGNIVGREIWRYVPTVGITEALADIPLTSGSAPQEFVRLNDSLVFKAQDASAIGSIWRTDGTSAGTESVFGGFWAANPGRLARFGDRVVFGGSRMSGPGDELWITDGTTAGSGLVRDLLPGAGSSDPGAFVDINGTMFFSAFNAGIGIWTTDGTAPGTQLVKNVSTTATEYPQAALNLLGLYLSGPPSAFPSPKLVRSDGTAGGTFTLGSFIGEAPTELAHLNGFAYFSANATGNQFGRELWRTDGTVAGTQLVKDIRPGQSGSDPFSFTVFGNHIYFAANDGQSGVELWRSDGTSAGTQRISDIAPGASSAFSTTPGAYLTNIGDRLAFIATEGTAEYRLWISDGTAAGTRRVAGDLPNGGPRFFSTSIPYFVRVGATMFFAAATPTDGIELWQTDFTSPGTTFTDIRFGPGDSAPSRMVRLGSSVFFAANDGLRGRELWRAGGVDTHSPLDLGSTFGVDARRPFARLMFDEPLTDDATDHLRLIDTDTGTVITAVSLQAYAHETDHSVYVTFGSSPASLPDGNYRLQLPASAVVDLAGNAATIDRTFDFFVLGGDATRDRRVDIADFAVLAARFNLPGTFSQGDFNYDGVTALADFAIMAANFNRELEPTQAAARAARPSLQPRESAGRRMSEWMDQMRELNQVEDSELFGLASLD